MAAGSSNKASGGNKAAGGQTERICDKYLQWTRTEEIEGTSSKIIKETGVAKVEPDKKGVPRTGQDSSLKYGIELVMKRASQTKANTVAVMWGPHAGVWYQGSCHHVIGESSTKIPARIAIYIGGLETDYSDWAFGWNCAEVQCIAKAYKKGKTDPGGDAPLRGCVFIAANSRKNLYGGCKTCKNWIKRWGGECYQPQV